MKLDLKTEITNLNGEAYENEDKSKVTLGQVLAGILGNTQEGGKMKLYSLAKKCHNDNSIELDDADLVLVKKAVEGATQYNTIVLGQILLLLEK